MNAMPQTHKKVRALIVVTSIIVSAMQLQRLCTKLVRLKLGQQEMFKKFISDRNGLA